jgi:two-component system response regulator RegA
MGDAASSRSLLVVDDDRVFREVLAASFARRGYTVETAANATEAEQVCARFAPARAVVDLRMPGASGLDVLRMLRQRFPDIAVVMLTGFGSIATAVEAIKIGAVNYLSKPAEPAEIEAAFTSEVVSSADDAFETPSLDRAQWEHIHRVLVECGGNISEAARRLNIHRRTLQRMLQKQPLRR